MSRKNTVKVISNTIVAETLRIPKWFASFLMRVLFIHKINKRCSKIEFGNNPKKLLEGYFKEQQISFNFKGLENIPKNGPFIMISNHPYGFLDGLIILNLMLDYFPSVKVTANFLLKNIPLFGNYAIAVNPFEKMGKKNMGGYSKVMQHLQTKSPVVMFPAGMVSTNYDGLNKPVRDKEWRNSSKNLIINAGVPVIPVYFKGGNSRFFHLMGKIHPILRTILIPYEFIKIKKQVIECHIGNKLDQNMFKKRVDPQKMYDDFAEKFS
jgi:putative hemolysin